MKKYSDAYQYIRKATEKFDAIYMDFPAGIDPRLVNSILLPTLPTIQVWSARRPWN